MVELNPSKTALIFPGQGSQAIGMGLALTESFSVARATFALADSILGITLSDYAWDGLLGRPTIIVAYSNAKTIYRVSGIC